MTSLPCPREDELLDALQRGFVGAELEAHAAGCQVCGELREVATALLEDRDRAMADAPVPSAGTTWWRMRLRQRREAETSARSSLLVGQGLTLAVAVALVIAFFGSELTRFALDLAHRIPLDAPRLLLALIVLLVVAPIAGWAAVRQR